jgi:hypothetical protein
MITEQNILDFGFEKQSYSTGPKQVYKLDLDRSEKYKQYDAHIELLIEVEESEDNPHKIFSKLKVGPSYGVFTKSWMGTLSDKGALEEKLTTIIRWNLTH